MEIYLYCRPYDEKSIRLKLRDLGFSNTRNPYSFTFEEMGISVHFANSEKGIYMLRGVGVEESIRKGISSVSYKTLQNLINILAPQSITDVNNHRRTYHNLFLR